MLSIKSSIEATYIVCNDYTPRNCRPILLATPSGKVRQNVLINLVHCTVLATYVVCIDWTHSLPTTTSNTASTTTTANMICPVI